MTRIESNTKDVIYYITELLSRNARNAKRQTNKIQTHHMILIPLPQNPRPRSGSRSFSNGDLFSRRPHILQSTHHSPPRGRFLSSRRYNWLPNNSILSASTFIARITRCSTSPTTFRQGGWRRDSLTTSGSSSCRTLLGGFACCCSTSTRLRFFNHVREDAGRSFSWDWCYWFER
jgi:hypothetical protein